MSSSLILDSTFVVPQHGNGSVRLRLVNAGRQTFSEFRLVFSSIVPLTPAGGSPAQLVNRTGTAHEITVPAELRLAPGGTFELGAFDCAYQLVHANDGPVRAYLVTADGATTDARCVPTERVPALMVGDEAPAPFVLSAGTDLTRSAWMVAAAREARLHRNEALILTAGGRTDGDEVTAGLHDALGSEEFRIDTRADHEARWHVEAGSQTALQWAFMELVNERRAGRPPAVGLRTSSPCHGFRGLMIDLARHFHPAVDVEHVIDLAAWRRINVLHLHLTDDQAWRVPSNAFPALAEVAACRGHGLPIPAQNGSGADAYGGCYSGEDIRRWVSAAAQAGIQLIPEIDLPGHSFAAIAALPELRDPQDRGDARSVHHFAHNVLNPGVPATRTFIETVFGEVAELFPGSPLHIGGDEVPDGAWASSPAAQAWAREREASDHRQIEAAFVADIVEMVKRSTGRRIGAWQEAAECGGLQPGDGYVIGWKSANACHRLAAAGYEVVAAPGSAYYLDMATGPEWHLPGMWWAGYVTSESIAAFDVSPNWDDRVRENLLGIQACLWGEHVPDRATLRAMLLPRLDAFGTAGWTTTPGPN